MSSDKNFLISISVILIVIYYFFKLDFLIFISVFFIIFAFIKPNLFHILNYIVYRIGLIFLLLLQPLILRVIFVLVFGIVGILMKVFRYDPFKLKKKKLNSFWRDRKTQVETLEDLKNQY